jgi:hypothetical protein
MLGLAYNSATSQRPINQRKEDIKWQGVLKKKTENKWGVKQEYLYTGLW